MAGNATTVGAVAFSLTLDSSTLGQAVNEAGRQISAQLSGSFRSALSGCEQSLAQIGQDVNRLNGDVRSQLTSATSSINGPLTRAVKKIGVLIASAFSAAVVVKFGQSCVEAAAQVKALNAQIEQTFGILEGDARKAIRSVANESGILETRLQSTGSQIYAFAKASGMDSVQALYMMKEALQLTADSAAFYDRSIESTAESLSSFLKGNYANDAALGISCTQATRNAAANKLYGKSFKELSEAQKQLTLLQMVKDANELSGAMGQAAREADGWENVTGNLKDAWKQLKAALGTPLLQALVPVIQNITASIERLTTTVKAASAALSDLFGWDLGAAKATGGAINDIARSVADSEDTAQKEIDETAEKQKKTIKSLQGFDDLNVLAQPDDSDDSDKAEDIAASVTAAKMSVDDLEQTVEAINFDSIKQKIQSVIDFVKPRVDGVKSFFGKISEYFSNWWENSGGPAFEKFKGSLTDIKNVVVDIWNSYISPFFAYVGETLKTFWDEHLAPLWDGILGFVASLMEAFSAIWDNLLRPIYDTFIKRIMVGVMGALKSLWDLVLDVFGIIVDVVRGVIRMAQGLNDFITGIFTGDLKKAVKGFAEFVEGIVIVIWGVIKGALNIIIDALNTVWSALYGVLKSIIDGVGDFVGLIGDFFGKDWGFSLPDEVPRIPRLASGGLVHAPTIAIVGDNKNARSDPEVISPLSKLNGMIGQSGANDALLGQIVTQQREILDEIKRIQGFACEGEMDGDVFFKGMIRRVENHKRTHGGRSPFG